MEGIASTAMESLHLVPVKQPVKKENTVTSIMVETGNLTTSAPSEALLPKFSRERKKKARQKETLASKVGKLQVETC